MSAEKNNAEHKIKHRALTGFVCRKWKRNTRLVQDIVKRCCVSECLGALPSKLRERVPMEHVAQVTKAFHAQLQSFLGENKANLDCPDVDQVYDLPQIGSLFGTKCVLMVRGINICGVSPWAGAVGYVCKLSFPQLNAHYALKLYFDDGPEWAKLDHGAWFETMTAFAANKAEPKDNNRVFMASVGQMPYLLSEWAGDKQDNIPMRENTNQIFVTSDAEEEERNRRAGRRIDWGETYRTVYGAMEYDARKIYRQIVVCDKKAVEKSIKKVGKNAAGLRNLGQALEMARLKSWHDNNQNLQMFVDNMMQCVR